MSTIVNVNDQFTAFADESAYGTAVPATKGYVFKSESVEGDYTNVIMSSGIKAGESLVNSQRVARDPKGAKGNIELEVDNQGTGFWLKHMLGKVTTGATTQGVTTHTFNLADKAGKSFTYQKKVVGSNAGGTAYTKTYQGGKVMDWELSNSVDQFLTLKLGLDFQKETIGAGTGAYAPQTPVYPTNVKTFKFYEAVVTIAGVQLDITDFSLKGKNNLADNSYFLGSQLKKEPLQDGHDDLTLELKVRFMDLAQQQRVASATESGAQAQVVATWTATEPESAGGLSSLTITMPVVSFIDASAPINGSKQIEQTIKGNVLWPAGSGQGTNPITAVLVTPDATV